MSDKAIHPGRYVRDEVLPKGMNVKKAAELLEVSRPTLSKLLNGKADLSKEMAARLEAAFGVSARTLLDVQSAWDAAATKSSSVAAAVKLFVPPFLEIKANRIEEWASTGIKPRHRLAVLLRILVHSTGIDLTEVDFPGNDDSERAGWDGKVEAGRGTPWIPEGRSGWEFGVTEDAKGKADGDFAKSVAAIDAAQRKGRTFVFVTPRVWPGKDAWIQAHKAKKLWKDVRAFDASDLEQWLEQSLAAQTWFANETGQYAHGAISLDEAAKLWAADCDPPLSPALFDDAVAASRLTLRRALTSASYQPTVISADSKDEALAFLSAAFDTGDAELGAYRDRTIVFREPGALSKLASSVTNFIPVILSRDVEKEFAPFRSSMPSFIIYPRNATAADADISLETLNWESFTKALEKMGLERDRIDQLSRESGRSPTVLRRRLSKLPAIRTPDWASDQQLPSSLIPFVLAGAWKADNKTDRAMLEILASDVNFEELERRVAALLPLDSSPVWSAGAFRGVVSKIDVLFAIQSSFTAADLQRFFDVAEIVLAEEDPALDLPEKDQWAAAIYGKTREISGALREGLAETLVLMAVYGTALFKARLNFDAVAQANRLVRGLLEPISLKTLQSQTDNLPLYSEAAPETFLSIIEADLRSGVQTSLDLMSPASEFPFGRAPRTGLLWALENLAWSDELFVRTVLVLGRLAERTIEDNLVNKPSGSLSAIFRSWMPQTSAKLEHRKAAFKMLADRHRDVAWPICMEQFSAHSRVGHYSHKPRWRTDGHGLGNPTTRGEDNDFSLFAFELALAWPDQSLQTICDLIRNLGGVSEELHPKVWDVVDGWILRASEEDKAGLRECIRTSTLTRRAAKDRGRGKLETADRAKQTYDRLEPADPVLRHGWLFHQAWVDESVDELEDANFDYRSRDQRIANLRTIAVREVFADGGVAAVFRLAEQGQAAHNVGWFLATVLDAGDELVAVLTKLIHGGEITVARALLISGALAKASSQGNEVLRKVAATITSLEKLVPFLISAPFGAATWKLAEEYGAGTAEAYWREVFPGWNREADEQETAVRRLITARRPRAAFQFAQHDLKELPPRLIYDLLVAILTSSDEPPKTYMLHPRHIQDAFELLNASGEMTIDEMAALEFQFIHVFERGKVKPVNLARRMAAQPELFVQAVAFAFRRSDDGVDPPEFHLADEERRSSRASHSYSLLEAIDVMPGEQDGELDAGRIVRWIEQAREALGTFGRQVVGEQMIGKILSKAPPDAEGVWPCFPVRDALEIALTDEIERGLHIALMNARGAHWRGEGGSQERTIAEKYRRWADAMEYTHPRVAAFLHRMEKVYLRDAEWEDNDAKIARRMRH